MLHFKIESTEKATGWITGGFVKTAPSRQNIFAGINVFRRKLADVSIGHSFCPNQGHRTLETLKSWGTELTGSFEILDDATQDFLDTANIDNAKGLLERLVVVFAKAPLKQFLSTSLPRADFQTWNAETNGREFSSGSRSLDWPAEIDLRASLQLRLLTLMSEGEIDPLGFSRQHFNRSHSLQHRDIFRSLAEMLLKPLIRDLRRLSEQRAIPAVLKDALRIRPRSADVTLDHLLEEATRCFADPAPAQRQRAIEKLWDAWERVKSLEDKDKKTSANLLLGQATSDAKFLEVLKNEASALSKIGNEFHIRHFEADRSEIVDLQQIDYLFHRMYALLQLLLMK